VRRKGKRVGICEYGKPLAADSDGTCDFTDFPVSLTEQIACFRELRTVFIHGFQATRGGNEAKICGVSDYVDG